MIVPTPYVLHGVDRAVGSQPLLAKGRLHGIDTLDLPLIVVRRRVEAAKGRRHFFSHNQNDRRLYPHPGAHLAAGNVGTDGSGNRVRKAGHVPL